MQRARKGKAAMQQNLASARDSVEEARKSRRINYAQEQEVTPSLEDEMEYEEQDGERPVLDTLGVISDEAVSSNILQNDTAEPNFESGVSSANNNAS